MAFREMERGGVQISSPITTTLAASAYEQVSWEPDDICCFALISSASYSSGTISTTSNSTSKWVRVVNQHTNQQTITYYLVHLKK